MPTRLNRLAALLGMCLPLLLIAGCASGGSGGKNAPGTQTVEVAPGESGRSITARVGESIIVRLPGRQGSDAVWRDQVPEALQLVSMGKQETGTIGPTKTPWTIAELKPRRAGKYTAQFMLVRVWQQTMENERTFRLIVEVTE